MKLKRILAGVAATAMAVSTMAVSAFADESKGAEGDTFLMFADSSWTYSNMSLAVDGGTGTDASVTGAGTYTVKATAEDGFGLQVFNVDILDFAKKYNCGVSNEAYADLDGTAAKKQFAVDAGIIIKDVKVSFDGEEAFTVDNDKLVYGDIEGNDKIRIEIFNNWGDTNNSSTDFYDEEIANFVSDVAFTEIEVTFTVEIAGENTDTPADTDTETPAEDKNDGDTNTSTGLAGMALAGLAVSGAAVVATKKRK